MLIYIYIYIYISFSSFQKYPSPLTKNERTPAVTLHENSHTHTHTIFFFSGKNKMQYWKQAKKACFTMGVGGTEFHFFHYREENRSILFFLFFKAMQFPSQTCALSPLSIQHCQQSSAPNSFSLTGFPSSFFCLSPEQDRRGHLQSCVNKK